MHKNGKSKNKPVQSIALNNDELEREADQEKSSRSIPPSPLSVSANGSRNGVWSLNSAETNKLLIFCDIVLKHVNYPQAFREQSQPAAPPQNDSDGSDDGERGESESAEESKNLKNERVAESPLNSVGESARESIRSSTSSTESVLAEMDTEDTGPMDKETYESVTCWCAKPFAGRPMIECDSCLIWYHMKCENVRRTSIPNEFHCSRCKNKKRRKKRAAQEKQNGPKKPAKRPSIETPKKSASVAAAAAATPVAAIPPTPPARTASLIASSRLSGGGGKVKDTTTSTTTTPRPAQSSPQAKRSSPSVEGATKGDESLSATGGEEKSLKSTPPVKKTKSKSKSLSPGSSPAKKLKKAKGGKQERRKSNGGAKKTTQTPPATTASTKTKPASIKSVSLLQSRLSTSTSPVANEVVKDNKSPAVAARVGLPQMPPLLPCYGAIGGNMRSAAPAQNFSAARGGHGFENGLPLPVLKPEVTPPPNNPRHLSFKHSHRDMDRELERLGVTMSPTSAYRSSSPPPYPPFLDTFIPPPPPMRPYGLMQQQQQQQNFSTNGLPSSLFEDDFDLLHFTPFDFTADPSIGFSF